MSLTKLILLFLSLLFLNSSMGEESKNKSKDSHLSKETLSEMEKLRTEPMISGKFSRGPFLIYDCQDRYFACVNDASYKKCQKFRKVGYQNKRKLLPCAPLKEFPTQTECFKKQYSLIHVKKSKGFCVNTKSTHY